MSTRNKINALKKLTYIFLHEIMCNESFYSSTKPSSDVHMGCKATGWFPVKANRKEKLLLNWCMIFKLLALRVKGLYFEGEKTDSVGKI